MADLIIKHPKDLQIAFDSPATRRYGRRSEYLVKDPSSKETTGYSAVQRAAERLNARGENLGTDEVLSQDNWDLI